MTARYQIDILINNKCPCFTSLWNWLTKLVVAIMLMWTGSRVCVRERQQPWLSYSLTSLKLEDNAATGQWVHHQHGHGSHLFTLYNHGYWDGGWSCCSGCCWPACTEALQWQLCDRVWHRPAEGMVRENSYKLPRHPPPAANSTLQLQKEMHVRPGTCPVSE